MNVNMQERLDLKKYRPAELLYIALDELDFSWYAAEVEQITELWAKGWPVRQIAKRYGRDPDEVAVLIMDLARRKKIQQRPGGAMGLSA